MATCLQYLSMLYNYDKLCVIDAIIEDNQSDYKEISTQDKTYFIIDNLTI